MTCAALSVAPDLELYHVGPSLDLGELPALFYLALSGPDSLCTDPYNQPVQFLRGRQIRIFSLTLPAHENGLSPHQALGIWAQEMAHGHDPLDQFLENATRALEFALNQKLVRPDKIAVAGLSRGGLLASLWAARSSHIHTILGFAPLTRLQTVKEFHNLPSNYDLKLHAPLLAKKRIRFYIGNRDITVSTKACFECIEEIVEAAHQQRQRLAQCELIISPSIGHRGHGTSPETFRQGAEWVASCLGVP